MTTDLRIKKAENQGHPNGPLWTYETPHEEEAFRHFAEGLTSIIESKIPELVYVAGLHGWTVTRDSEDNVRDQVVRGSKPGRFHETIRRMRSQSA